MKMLFLAALACATMALGACSDNDDNDAASATEGVVPGTNHKVLIAYFSEPLPDGTDANTSASRVVAGNRLYGSVEYMATVIGEATGGDMVRIQTETPYPGNFDDLAAQADNERQNGIHPTLSTSIEGFDNYDVVFVGYPIWWYQMPMPMYSFFDRYDFSGKTIIPFSSHGVSGWSGTIADIAGLEPEATMVDGFSTSRSNVASSAEEIRNWLRDINIIE